MTPLTAFITGISTGGLTCMAVQGGLLLALLARRQGDSEATTKWQRLVVPVGAFLIAKIIAYTLLGLGLGAAGAKLQLTSGMSVWLQSIAGVFIIITGLRLIWPNWLPWLSVTPPARMRRYIRGHAKSENWLAPAMLGVLTIFIPCGTTIAMEAAAVATGSAWQGAAILFAFTLGTAPLFFLFGILAKGTVFLQKRLMYATTVIVIGLGLYTINGALVMVDSPYSFQNEVAAFRRVFMSGDSTNEQALTTVTITARSTGYSPKDITVPAGESIRLALVAKGQLGCASIFRIPKLEIEESLAPNSTRNLTVMFPEPGRYSFSCGMGMFTGTITAV